MEVRAKYKQSEIGIIPEDWDSPILGDLFTFKNGLNKAKAFFGYGTPIVNYMDVYERRGLYLSDLQGQVSLNKQEIKAFDVRKGDVFFTRTSETVEEVGISSVMLDEPRDTVFSGFVLRARSIDDTLDDQFKKYCFSTSSVRRQITSQSTETTRALTNGKCLSAVMIAKPPKPEQTVIAIALSDTDALISSLEKLITKKRHIKQGAMQLLLTSKKRLPGFTGEWETKRLRDIGKCIRGVSYNSEKDLFIHDTEKSVRLLRSNNVQNGNLNLNNLQFVNTERVKRIQELQSGDIVICMANGSKQLVGKAAYYMKNDLLRYTFGAFMGCFRINTAAANSSFIAYHFKTYKYRTHIDILLSGSSINNLKPSDIEFFEILFPKIKEQTAIAQVLSDMDAEIEELERKLAKYQLIKQGMMQELLTGKKRLI